MKVSFEAAPAFCIINDVTVDRYDRFKMDARVWMHRVAALQRKVLQTLRKGNVLRVGIDTRGIRFYGVSYKGRELRGIRTVQPSGREKQVKP